MILGRRLGGIPASVMAFTSNGVFLLAGLAFGAVFSWLDLPASGHTAIDFTTRAWTVPGGIDLLLMMSCGVTAAIGIAGLTFAYREAEANLVASFEYTGLIWAIIWGLVIWGDVPRATTLAGAVLIVGAGLVALAAGGRRQEA